jgi:hypothetical protein
MEQTPMPITRRRRANPPDQPENNNTNHITDQSELVVTPSAEAPVTEQPGDTPVPIEAENANAIAASSLTMSVSSTVPSVTPLPASMRGEGLPYQAVLPVSTVNGDRGESRVERQDYVPSIEPGRRTVRGELFRRPPQLPTSQSPVPAMSAVPLQAPSHEISLPLGNLLHLAYNPSYTGAEEARVVLLHKLAQETKIGGRGRCWSCGSLAIAYDHWNTKSKSFGEVGIAFCEICGVWSIM